MMIKLKGTRLHMEKVQIGKLTLPKLINNPWCQLNLTDAEIKYGKYLTIPISGIKAKSNITVREPICLKIVVTLHKESGQPFGYQFTSREIADLLSAETVTKHTNNHIVDFDFDPFAKYDKQKRKTTGKLDARLSMDDPEEQEWWDAYVDNSQYDQVGNGLL